MGVRVGDSTSVSQAGRTLPNCMCCDVLPVFRPICLGRSLIYPLGVTLRAAPHSSETRRVRPRRHLTCCDGLHAPVLVSKSSRRAEWRFIPARDCPFCCCLAVSPLLALHDARDFRAGSDARHSGGKGGGDRLHDNKAGAEDASSRTRCRASNALQARRRGRRRPGSAARRVSEAGKARGSAPSSRLDPP